MSVMFGAKILEDYREKFYKEFSERVLKENSLIDLIKGISVEAISQFVQNTAKNNTLRTILISN